MKNIVLLTIDTLRADMLGCYGLAPSVTPNIDRLAGRGILFDNAITGGSWTQAAFPGIFSSTHASMYGGCLGPLALERPSPVQALAAAGYTTVGFTTNPLIGKAYGYDRGFSHFYELVPEEQDPPLRKIKGGEFLLRQPATHKLLSFFKMRAQPARLYSSAVELTSKAEQWIAGNSGPFFMWLHYMDIHWPYHLEEDLRTPEEIAGAWRDMAHLHGVNWKGAAITPEQKDRYVSLYTRALEFLDRQIGRFILCLEKLGMLDDTIIVVVSDHGEEFLERGRWGHLETNLYDEIIRIPLIICLPDPTGPQTVSRQVSTLDIMPTIMDLAACLGPSGLAGASMVPLWTGRPAEYEAEYAISEMWREHWHIVALRSQEFKYIWNSRNPDRPILIDLETDPGEKTNVLDRHPEQAGHFRALLEAHFTNIAQSTPSDPNLEPELDSQVIRRLRDLGYVE